LAVGGDHPLVDAPGGLDLDVLVGGEQIGQSGLLLVGDARADLLPVRATSSGQEIEATIRDREPQVVDRVGWLRIDDAERRAGRAEQRPRVRQTDVRRLVKLAAE